MKNLQSKVCGVLSRCAGAVVAFTLMLVASATASAQDEAVDYDALVTAVKPDVNTQDLMVATYGALLEWWLPVVVLAILFAYIRFALKKSKGSVNGGGI